MFWALRAEPSVMAGSWSWCQCPFDLVSLVVSSTFLLVPTLPFSARNLPRQDDAAPVQRRFTWLTEPPCPPLPVLASHV